MKPRSHGRSLSGRRKFSGEEDDRLRALILQFGNHDWGSVCQFMPGRNPRQCRHRYNNYLVDAHQQGPWTTKEEDLIMAKYDEVGPKWVFIAGFLCGRTGNDVKNRWHKHIYKRYVSRESPCAKAEPTEPENETMPPPSGPPRDEMSGFLRFVLN
jgi:hypothetical protein